MALENILATIKKEATDIAQKIKDDGTGKIAELNNEYQVREKKIREQILAETENENEKRIEQAKFQLQNQKKSEILKMKQAILDEVFNLAISKLAKMPATDQIDLLTKLIKSLPSIKEGELIPVKNSSELLKKAKTKSGTHYNLSHKSVSGQGGFVFFSPELEIDNRYSALTSLVRDEVETEVANLLFAK